MIDDDEHLWFLRSIEWFGEIAKFVHDVPSSIK
jgi:hypothetical protein